MRDKQTDPLIVSNGYQYQNERTTNSSASQSTGTNQLGSESSPVPNPV